MLERGPALDGVELERWAQRKMITPKISDHACAIIPGLRLFRHRASNPNKHAEQHDSCDFTHALIQMADAEYDCLVQDCPSDAPSHRLKLFLKIAAKGEFLTKSC